MQLSHALLEATEDVSEGRDDLGCLPALVITSHWQFDYIDTKIYIHHFTSNIISN